MLRPKLENKVHPSAADTLQQAEARIATITAELAELGMQSQRNEPELGYAEPEEVKGLEAERTRLAGQRAKLESECATLEGTLPEIRSAIGREEWAFEITKRT